MALTPPSEPEAVLGGGNGNGPRISTAKACSRPQSSPASSAKRRRHEHTVHCALRHAPEKLPRAGRELDVVRAQERRPDARGAVQAPADDEVRDQCLRAPAVGAPCPTDEDV